MQIKVQELKALIQESKLDAETKRITYQIFKRVIAIANQLIGHAPTQHEESFTLLDTDLNLQIVLKVKAKPGFAQPKVTAGWRPTRNQIYVVVNFDANRVDQRYELNARLREAIRHELEHTTQRMPAKTFFAATDRIAKNNYTTSDLARYLLHPHEIAAWAVGIHRRAKANMSRRLGQDRNQIKPAKRDTRSPFEQVADEIISKELAKEFVNQSDPFADRIKVLRILDRVKRRWIAYATNRFKGSPALRRADQTIIGND